MVVLKIGFHKLEVRGLPKVNKCNFWKSFFWPPLHSEDILDIREGQNEVKVIKCKVSKSLFLISMHSESIKNLVKVIKCNFSNSLFLSSFHLESILNNREGQNEANVIQGHQVQFF